MFSTKLGLVCFLMLSLVGLSMSVCADTYEPVAHCYKPSKPLMFSTGYYKNRYNQDVADYQTCLKTFIEHQEYAAKMHKEAAKNALKIWNDFATDQ